MIRSVTLRNIVAGCIVNTLYLIAWNTSHALPHGASLERGTW